MKCLNNNSWSDSTSCMQGNKRSFFFTLQVVKYPGCQRSSRSPAARSVRRPQREKKPLAPRVAVKQNEWQKLQAQLVVIRPVKPKTRRTFLRETYLTIQATWSIVAFRTGMKLAGGGVTTAVTILLTLLAKQAPNKLTLCCLVLCETTEEFSVKASVAEPSRLH